MKGIGNSYQLKSGLGRNDTEKDKIISSSGPSEVFSKTTSKMEVSFGSPESRHLQKSLLRDHEVKSKELETFQNQSYESFTNLVEDSKNKLQARQRNQFVVKSRNKKPKVQNVSNKELSESGDYRNFDIDKFEKEWNEYSIRDVVRHTFLVNQKKEKDLNESKETDDYNNKDKHQKTLENFRKSKENKMKCNKNVSSPRKLIRFKKNNTTSSNMYQKQLAQTFCRPSRWTHRGFFSQEKNPEPGQDFSTTKQAKTFSQQFIEMVNEPSSKLNANRLPSNKAVWTSEDFRPSGKRVKSQKTKHHWKTSNSFLLEPYEREIEVTAELERKFPMLLKKDIVPKRYRFKTGLQNVKNRYPKEEGQRGLKKSTKEAKTSSLAGEESKASKHLERNFSKDKKIVIPSRQPSPRDHHSYRKNRKSKQEKDISDEPPEGFSDSEEPDLMRAKFEHFRDPQSQNQSQYEEFGGGERPAEDRYLYYRANRYARDCLRILGIREDKE